MEGAGYCQINRNPLPTTRRTDFCLGGRTTLDGWCRAIAGGMFSSIETLGAATDLDEIRKDAVLPENIDATIDSVTTEVDALSSLNIQN